MVKLKIPDIDFMNIKLPLTAKQKLYYKNVLIKNYKGLTSIFESSKAKTKMSFTSVLTNLRLICDHPKIFVYKRNYDIPKTRPKFE